MKVTWRHFWAQRSRSRLTLAVVCLAAALVAVGFVYVPAAWLEQAGATFQALSAYVLAFGSRALLFVAGGALVVLAALVVALPRRRPHPYWVRHPQTVAQVSVYVDAENQLQKSELVRPFVHYLRKYLHAHHKGQRADLLYFADASQSAHRKTYEELYRFGFRPVDVPHVAFEDEEVKNAVDIELSLHAFERALHGARGQHFILVTGDRDYLPLIFRLHALGHTVSVWAAAPSLTFQLARNFLDDVEVIDLDDVFSHALNASEPVAHPATPTVPPRKRKRAKSNVRRGSLALASQTPHPAVVSIDPRERVSIADAITYTLEVINTLNTSSGFPEKRRHLFPIRLGAAQGNFLKRLGYEGSTRIECWIAELAVLGVLRAETPGVLPAQGDTDPARAAQDMERFVNDMAAVALGLARERQDSIISYQDISTRIGASTGDSVLESTNPLRALVIAGSPKALAHTRYICLCARALGLIRFEEVVPGGAIRIDSLPPQIPPADSSLMPTEPGT